MSASTPINQIRNRQNHGQPSGQQTDDQLMNDILKEMEVGPGEDNISDMNANSFQYPMDQSQVPPEKIASSKFDDISASLNQSLNSQLGEDDVIINSNNLNSRSSGLSGITNLSMSLNTTNLKDTIINFVKIPLVVLALCFIFGLPQVNKFIFKFFPNLLLESGQITMLGNFLKALVIALLVMLVQYFF